jgi:hypothetical protein
VTAVQRIEIARLKAQIQVQIEIQSPKPCAESVVMLGAWGVGRLRRNRACGEATKTNKTKR